jgi:hypothetical protein
VAESQCGFLDKIPTGIGDRDRHQHACGRENPIVHGRRIEAEDNEDLDRDCSVDVEAVRNVALGI